MKKLLKLMVGAGMMMSVPFAVANSKIEEVFSYDMIGTDLAYLESIIGIARKTNTYNDTKEYIVNGCHLEVGYNEQSVETLSVDLTDRCQFVLKNIIPYNDNLPSNKVVFGMTGPVSYYAPCLGLCGNAYEPPVYELYQAPRVHGFRELLLSSVSDSYEARSEWYKVMAKKEGEEWVNDARYNCEPNKYSSIAKNIFEGEKIDKITIGYNLEERKSLQQWCEDYNRENYTAPQDTSGINKIPFDLAYESKDYVYLVGSEILEGEVKFAYNDMDGGYQVWFIPNEESNQRIGLQRKLEFTLNDYYDLSLDSLEDIKDYLNFNIDFPNSEFKDIEKSCSLKGNATLQITGISIYYPENSEYNVSMRSLKNLGSGPYKMVCQR